MAKSAGEDELIFEALERALADPTPRKLHGTKANPGIFLSSSVAAKRAAQRCLDQHLIAVCDELRTKSKVTPLYGLAPAGIGYLLEQAPAQRLLTATRDTADRLVDVVTGCQQTLVGVQRQMARLQEVVQAASARLSVPNIDQMLATVAGRHATSSASPDGARPPHGTKSPDGAQDRAANDAALASLTFEHIQQHTRQAPLRPLALPQLWERVRAQRPGLSLGAFHDALRSLAAAGRIRLSPFTQAMYQLAEPECAMIVGREIMYYVESV